MSDIKVVANGAGAAGIAIIKLLYRYGVRDIIMCDRKGAIYDGRPTGMNPVKDEVAKYTNKNRIEGSLADVVQGADVFIGVSAEGALTEEMVRTMNDDAIILQWRIQFQKLCQNWQKQRAQLLLEQVVLTSRTK